MNKIVQLLALGANLAAVASAAVNPLSPSPGNTFREGSPCAMQYALDTTGLWSNMTIDLMTGSNFAMSLVTNVATGIDGTTGSGTYSWTCPSVTPNSAIYFYQFSLGGNSPTWTTRFTIAAANGDVTPPEFSSQPGATGAVAIPYGIGRLRSGAVVVAPTASSSRAVGTGSASSTSVVSLGPLTSLAPVPATATATMITSTVSSVAAVVTRSSSAAVVATSSIPTGIVPAATTAAVARPTSSGEILRAGTLLSLVFGIALFA